MDIMSILAVLKWFIASLIVYGVLSLFVGIFIGILQYFTQYDLIHVIRHCI